MQIRKSSFNSKKKNVIYHMFKNYLGENNFTSQQVLFPSFQFPAVCVCVCVCVCVRMRTHSRVLTHPTLCDPHGPQHTRLPCTFTIFQRWFKFLSVESVMLSNHLILCHPLSFPPEQLWKCANQVRSRLYSCQLQTTPLPGRCCIVFRKT